MSTREQLIAAAGRVLRQDGLARLSTRSVARAAGVSETALYKHFDTKEALLIAAIEELVAPFTAITHELPTRIGLGRIEDTLEELVLANYRFVLQAGPIWSSLHADPQLHQRFIALMGEGDKGPHHAMGLLARYLAAEQRLGRIHAEPAPEAIADVLMAIAHFHASLDAGIDRTPDEGRVKATLSAALLGLLPPAKRSS